VRVLITGAAGFIARNFAEQYADQFEETYYADKLADCSDSEYFNSLPEGNLFRGCISGITKEWLNERAITHVVNFAAESHVDNSIASPVTFTVSNTFATHSLLEACRQYGEIEMFVQVGTDEVYGTLDFHDRPFTEEHPLVPNSPYSASKAAQDLMCRAYFETYGFPVVITRCSNNYGPWQHPEKFIPKSISRLMNGEKIPVYGNGENIRDWIHVIDHCHGLYLAMRWGTPGMVYNFGGSCEIGNLEVIKSIVSTLEDLEVINPVSSLDDAVEFVKDRLGHDLRYSIDFWLSSRELGFTPLYDFDESILDLVRWAMKNKEWLDARSK
jgi:dTDP-glucose 4,6-dehydratase